MIQIMQQKGVIGLASWGQTERGIACVVFLVRWIPCLRIGGIGDYGIHIEWIIGIYRVIFIKIRPVIFQRIAVASKNIVRQNTAHDKIHACQVVGVFFQLLCIVLNVIFTPHIAGRAFSDIDQQRAGTACRIVNFYRTSSLQMMRHNF